MTLPWRSEALFWGDEAMAPPGSATPHVVRSGPSSKRDTQLGSTEMGEVPMRRRATMSLALPGIRNLDDPATMKESELPEGVT